MAVSTQGCAALLHHLPVLSLVKRDVRRSGTSTGTAVLAALAALDGASAPVAPSGRAGPLDPHPSPIDPGHAEGHRVGELAAKLQVDLSVASRQVGQLIEMGAVERVVDPADRRVHLLRVTPSGHRELASARERAAEHLAGRLTSWSEPDLQTLVALLGRLRADLTDHQPVIGPAPVPDRAPAHRPSPHTPES